MLDALAARLQRYPRSAVRWLPLRIHAVLDVTGLLFVGTSPWIFHYNGIPAAIAVGFGVAGLGGNLLIDTPVSPFKLVPAAFHPAYDWLGVVGMAALAVALHGTPASAVFGGSAVALAGWSLVTDYG